MTVLYHYACGFCSSWFRLAPLLPRPTSFLRHLSLWAPRSTRIRYRMWSNLFPSPWLRTPRAVEETITLRQEDLGLDAELCYLGTQFSCPLTLLFSICKMDLYQIATDAIMLPNKQPRKKYFSPSRVCGWAEGRQISSGLDQRSWGLHVKSRSFPCVHTGVMAEGQELCSCFPPDG